jgi:YaiO family outer membrane protein
MLALAAAAGAQGEPDQRAPTAPVTTLGIDYSYAWFQGDLDPWHQAAFSAATKRPRGTLIARINAARRFAMDGAQFEVDAYPVFGPKTYAYLNTGYSNATIFPEWRYGAELFQTLPRAMEASLGVRHLGFVGSPVTLFTGSVGRYTGNYWFSVRPFVRDKDGDMSASATLTGRRYGADADSYIGARIGYGSVPGEILDFSQLSRTNSISAGLHGSRVVSARTIFNWLLNYEREERPSTAALNRWEVGTGVKLRY